MPRDAFEKIPGVDQDHIEAVASLVPSLPNIRAQIPDRFAQAIRTLVEKRACRGWPNEGGEDFAVFVLVDHPRPVGERHGAEPFADPIATEIPLLGRLFFANCYASAGRSIPIPTDQNAILEWLDDAHFAKCPTVMVYRNTMTMVSRLAGTNDIAKNDPIRDREPSATLTDLLDALHQFHMQKLLIPSSCPDGVWKTGRASQYVPDRRPEQSIQSTLETALNFYFRGSVKAELEDSTNIGRIDVRLLITEERGSLAYWAIIELKVIRSFTTSHTPSRPSPVSDAANANAIADGVRQATAYRVNRQAQEGLLEVYDLRKQKRNDMLKSPSVTSATRQCTELTSIRVRPLFGSANDARRAGYTGV